MTKKVINTYIFNPEHDIALAQDNEFFTPPHAARALAADLSYLPAIWAGENDVVVVDNPDAAKVAMRHRRRYCSDVKLLTWTDLRSLKGDALRIVPWGWDKALYRRFLRVVDDIPLITPGDPDAIRAVSSREWAASNLLPYLVESSDLCVGKAQYVTTIQEVCSVCDSPGLSVLKAPWSSSGRGVRYVMGDKPFAESRNFKWVQNVIKSQTGIMIEPYYNKICDFGMEFEIVDNKCVYMGLSLFQTRNGAYTGNLICPEDEKMGKLSRYIPVELLATTAKHISQIMENKLCDIYQGPFGVDMMIVNVGGKAMLHPCVELNLRMTMGHVALNIQHHCPGERLNMFVGLENDKYRMRVRKL